MRSRGRQTAELSGQKMRVYLHIGYPKTGSSAIQSHVHSNLDWFQRRGFYIPRAGYASGLGHCFLVNPGSQPFTPMGSIRALDSNSQFDRLAKELAAQTEQGYDKALVSWEGFALMSQQTITEMATVLGDHEIFLLAYVRDQVSLYQSSSIQLLESLRSPPADRFFREGYIRNDDLARFDFHATLSMWQRCFGASLTPHVRIYDRQRLLNGNVVIDFLQWLGLQPDDEFALQTKSVNHSLDTRAAGLLLAGKAAGINRGRLVRLSRALSEVAKSSNPASYEFLASSDREYIYDHFKDSNTKLFIDFRPDNADHDQTGFDRKVTREQSRPSVPEFEYFRDVYNALQSPPIEKWVGGPLISTQLGLLTRRPASGWRGAEQSGVWSLGPISELLFQIPKTGGKLRPSAICLHIAGHYFEGQEKTRVTTETVSLCLDLTKQEFNIPLSETMREQGVRILLEHEFAPPGQENAECSEQLGFKLQYISYGLVWDE